MKKQKAAVITGDIIGSSALNTGQRKKLQIRLTRFIASTQEAFPDCKAELYRGDSLQAVFTRSRVYALRTALQLQTFLLINGFSIRQAIGLGDISFVASQVRLSDGSAFQASGPLADELKKRGEIIAITASDASFTKEWSVHSASLNYLLQRVSLPQAEALYLQLQDLTQEQIAAELRISQPSVHQRLQASGWAVINAILERFEQTVAVL